MVDKFIEGEVYKNNNHDQYIMVLGIGSENSEEVILAILWVDRESLESTDPGEITIKKTDFSSWEQVNLG